MVDADDALIVHCTGSLIHYSEANKAKRERGHTDGRNVILCGGSLQLSVTLTSTATT